MGIGQCRAPVARVLVATVVDIQRDVLRLRLLDLQRQHIAVAILSEVCGQLAHLRIVEQFELRGELRDIDLLLVELFLPAALKSAWAAHHTQIFNTKKTGRKHDLP